MAYTTINKSTDHFNTVLYTGNGANARGITGVGFKPDFVWNKGRDDTWQHILTDIVRGATKNLYTDSDSAEVTDSTRLQSFDSDGFTVGTNNQINNNTDTYVAWNWLAGGSQGSSNTDGSINTTYTSVNTTAGFSISTYEGTGSAATVGHGLGVTPAMVLVKNIDAAQNWLMYHQDIGATKYLRLNLTNGQGTSSGPWNNTAPTSSVFYIGADGAVTGNGQTHVAYCFAEKTGYSKFGSFTGNGNVDGPFVFCGFKPAFVLAKNSSINDWWSMFDNKRLGFNSSDSPRLLFPSANSTESTSKMLDFTSNGFKIRSTNTGVNGNGNTTIFMAFGQSIVGSNNVPCTAT